MTVPAAGGATTTMGPAYVARAVAFGLASVAVLLGVDRLIHAVLQRTGSLHRALEWRPDAQFHVFAFAAATAAALLAMYVAEQLPLKWWLVAASAVVFGIGTQLGARVAVEFLGEWLGTLAWFGGGAAAVVFLAHIWNHRD